MTFGDPPRRAQPAGQAVIVLVIGLLIAAFLNARGLHRSAEIAEPGVGRDVRLALTGALAGVSGALGLDLPRKGLQAAIGREGVDDVDTSIDFQNADAGTGGGEGDAEPFVPQKPVYTPDRPLRIMTAGDSLAIVPGQALVRIAANNPVLQSAAPPDGQLASGLERPDVYNWFDTIPEEVERLKPGLVVLSFGGNDDHGYMTGPGGDTVDGFGTTAWRTEYARRVGGLMSEIAAAGAMSVWLLPPITRDPARNERYQLIGEVISQEAAKRPARVRVVDTYALLADSSGAYVDYASDGARLRAPDGIHLDVRGGDVVAREVIAKTREMADLRRPKPAPKATTTGTGTTGTGAAGTSTAGGTSGP